jgi:ankyrin repeat protein
MRMLELQKKQLLDAISNGDLAQIREILEQGRVDLNGLYTSDYTPLHHAVVTTLEERRLETVRCLLEHGSNPNKQNNLGLTPLHYVAYLGNSALSTNMIECLLANRANPNIEAFGSSALFLMVSRSNVNRNALEIMLNHGANINFRDTNGSSVLEKALIYSYDTIDLVQYLVTRGADFLGANSEGDTLLHVAVKHSRIQALNYFSQIAGAFSLWNTRNYAGQTVLEYATNEEQNGQINLQTLTQIQDCYQEACVREQARNQRNLQTFFMGSHGRVGRQSIVRILPLDVLGIIAQQVVETPEDLQALQARGQRPGF